MAWEIKYHPLAKEELARLDGSVRKIVLKGIIKVSANPKPQSEGGYGKPLGNKAINDLTGLLKIKYRDIGIRVVYKKLESEVSPDEKIISEKEYMKVSGLTSYEKKFGHGGAREHNINYSALMQM